MENIDKNTFFWNYLSSGQKGLLEEGLYLLQITRDHQDDKITDYSYLVFPFAKAYEGFLKQLFLDLAFISKKDYDSDRFRIGKALNPHLEKRLRYTSIYDKLVHHTRDRILADQLWSIWKRGRNLVFHYFPHNLKALTLAEAENIIQEMISVMEEAVVKCRVEKNLLH